MVAAKEIRAFINSEGLHLDQSSSDYYAREEDSEENPESSLG
jgi:hypothetical protein